MTRHSEDDADLGYYLKFFSFLSNVDDAGATELLASAELAEVPAGCRIIEQGDTSTSFYILVSGQVRVSRWDDRETELARLGAGAVIGEIAALTGRPRCATVETLSPCRLVRFRGTCTPRVLAEHPRLRDFLARIAARRADGSGGSLTAYLDYADEAWTPAAMSAETLRFRSYED